MKTLKELMHGTDFICGVELVSTRGALFEPKVVQTSRFGKDLAAYNKVDWVSITDNAGGNPMLSPLSLGKQIKDNGKELVIHISCKDFNRNGLESQLWLLASEGLNNILALTGDAPISGNRGRGKPVFDIDSVGLLSLIQRMNNGLLIGKTKSNKELRLKNTNLYAGAVTTNFKLLESEVIPQLLKLEKKIETGAKFIINQIGYDARKKQEQLAYMKQNGMGDIPLIGNVYVLSGMASKVFNQNLIPGVVVTDNLKELCIQQAKAEDKGKAFFKEFAAKQIAVYKGLGYKGVYVGGVHHINDLEHIFKIEQSFSNDDWKQFISEINFNKPKEFYLYNKDESTSLSNTAKNNSIINAVSKKPNLNYTFSNWVHNLMFTENKGLFSIGKGMCSNAKDSFQGPFLMRGIEHLSKSMMFSCKDCGDCSLPETAFLCPESQCAKNQRNGPCGGTIEGKCEVLDKECIWSKAYKRLKTKGEHLNLLSHVPAVQDQGLRGTSSWANSWLKRDHIGGKNTD